MVRHLMFGIVIVVLSMALAGCAPLGDYPPAEYPPGDRPQRTCDKSDDSPVQKACDGGDMQGCNNQGVRYRTGLGVPRDDKCAAYFFQKACDRGYTPGCNNLRSSHAPGHMRSSDGVHWQFDGE
jgi:TPR repeat protein